MTDHSAELISHYSERLIERSGYGRAGFPQGYDEHRPSPPTALLDVLSLAARVERPRLVVDLGSGTGLSTRVWAGRADEAIGIEPGDEMRARAEEATSAPNVRYLRAYAQDTGLPGGVADVVTCSQSLHWMEPEPTFAEAARILRPGGVFAAYDYDWPPVVDWEVEAAFVEMQQRREELRDGGTRIRYRKDEHLARLRASGHFRFTREIVLHGTERGNADRIVGMALSIGPLVRSLGEGASEEEVGLAGLREAAARALGERAVTIFICYRVRLGVK